MANRYYDPINGGVDLQIWKDPQVLSRADLEAERDTLLSVQGLSDALRTTIAQSGLSAIGLPSFAGSETTLADFDSYIDDELDRLRDTLDVFDYESGSASISIRTGDWFLPEAVEDVSAEESGNEAGFAIDAVGGGDPDPNDPLSSTFWQSNAAGLRVITFRLRSYTKRVEGIRLRTNAGDARSQLQGLTVKASNSLNLIDDPSNTQVTGVNVDDLTAPWYQIDFVKARCRYIRLECSTSAHTNPDHVRIRTIQARVGIINHDK